MTSTDPAPGTAEKLRTMAKFDSLRRAILLEAATGLEAAEQKIVDLCAELTDIGNALLDRDALVEVFRKTRCIATPKLARGYCCPVPEEAERMADAVLAALSNSPGIPDGSRWSLAQVAGMIRRNCTPSSEAYQRGGDALIYAVADWVENPPEWPLAAQPTGPEAGVAADALGDLRESIEQELELGGDASTLVPAVTEWLKRWPLAALSTQPAAGAQRGGDELRKALTTVRGIVKRNYRDAHDILSIIDIALFPHPAEGNSAESTVTIAADRRDIPLDRPLSPDCWSSKHRACHGDAWSAEEDRVCDCSCECHRGGEQAGAQS